MNAAEWFALGVIVGIALTVALAFYWMNQIENAYKSKEGR